MSTNHVIEVKPEVYVVDEPAQRFPGWLTIFLGLGLATVVLTAVLPTRNSESHTQHTLSAERLCQVAGLVSSDCIFELVPICDSTDGTDQPFGCLLIDRRSRTIHWTVTLSAEYEAACRDNPGIYAGCVKLDLS